MTTNTGAQKNILVIKLGALGDFFQALGPMAAIRQHHANDHITLLTTAPFAELASKSGYVDEVWLDARPKWNQWKKWLDLRSRLNGANFTRVYDLQNNDRTSLYFRLFKTKPEWSGIAKGASHQNASPERTQGKAFDGHVQTLRIAGIHNVRADSLSWMQPDHDFSSMPERYVLICPGASPQHPEKRWPAHHVGVICEKLLQSGIHPVLIGGPAEQDICDQIASLSPDIINLAGQTSLYDIPHLARGAMGAIGNDTGPMHIAAQAGCKSLVLFSAKSDPKRHAPLGPYVATIQQPNLEDLKPDHVWKAFSDQLLLV